MEPPTTLVAATQDVVIGLHNRTLPGEHEDEALLDSSGPRSSPSTSGTGVYSQQANPAFEAEMAARTASREAAFLAPHLRPGMQVLDVGCGPGSITAGIAETVAPGLVVGFDIQTTQIDRARQLAAERGLATVRFAIADCYGLPFPDDSFDLAFANGVLMHLRDPVMALAELHRVLRPNGLVAVRDPGVSLRAPDSELLQQWSVVAQRVKEHNGGETFVGRHHRRLLVEAGFARTVASASVESAGTLEETLHQAEFLKAQVHGFARTALAEGWTDQATVDAILAEIDIWSRRPDAFFAATWCETLAWVTGEGERPE